MSQVFELPPPPPGSSGISAVPQRARSKGMEVVKTEFKYYAMEF